MPLAEQDKADFIAAYNRFQMASSAAGQRHAELSDANAKLRLARGNREKATATIGNWDSDGAMATADALHAAALAHRKMADAMVEQAASLKATTEIAVKIINAGKEDSNAG